MELHTVESSMIQAFGYNAETQTLLVIFNSGKAYHYFGVPPEVYEERLISDSKGSYIRDLVNRSISLRIGEKAIIFI